MGTTSGRSIRYGGGTGSSDRLRRTGGHGSARRMPLYSVSAAAVHGANDRIAAPAVAFRKTRRSTRGLEKRDTVGHSINALRDRGYARDGIGGVPRLRAR